MKNPINIKSKFKLFYDKWSPKVIAEMNDYQFKLVKIKGDFIWHSHQNTDEVFIVIKGKMYIEFDDRMVKLKEGDLFVVSKEENHRPFAKEECEILIIEPKGVLNTGDEYNKLTSKNDVWI